MRDVFNPQFLAQIIAQLGEDGHRCIIFEGVKGLRLALSNPRTKLLLLGTSYSEIPQLVETIRSDPAGRDIPILFCFKQHCLKMRKNYSFQRLTTF